MPFWLKKFPSNRMILEWLLVITFAVGISIGWSLARWFPRPLVRGSDRGESSAPIFVLTSAELFYTKTNTSTELATLGTLTDVVRWVGINTAIWDLTSRGFGTLPNMRVLACQPPESVLRVINGLRIPILRADGRPEMTQDESGADVPAHRGLTMVESIQVALVWRVCRQAFQMPDVDLYSPSYLAPASGSMGVSPSAAALAPSPLGASKTGAKKIKVNQILDQMDDSELDILPQRQLDEAFQLFRSRMGSDPLKEHEPSPEQITAMYNKVVIQGDSPYADFSVLTPFGRRSQKQMKAKGFMLQEDGSWKQLEIPGPPSFESWQACWQIYKTALLMLQYPSSGIALLHPRKS